MKKPVVFYVDDEQDNLDSLEMAAPDTWDLHLFNDGYDAIKALTKLKPVLMITDIMMPGIHGLDLALYVKKLHSEITVVAISGLAKNEVEKNYGDLGTMPFFRKPIGTDFFDKLSEFIKSPA